MSTEWAPPLKRVIDEIMDMWLPRLAAVQRHSEGHRIKLKLPREVKIDDDAPRPCRLVGAYANSTWEWVNDGARFIMCCLHLCGLYPPATVDLLVQAFCTRAKIAIPDEYEDIIPCIIMLCCPRANLIKFAMTDDDGADTHAVAHVIMTRWVVPRED